MSRFVLMVVTVAVGSLASTVLAEAVYTENFLNDATAGQWADAGWYASYTSAAYLAADVNGVQPNAKWNETAGLDSQLGYLNFYYGWNATPSCPGPLSGLADTDQVGLFWTEGSVNALPSNLSVGDIDSVDFNYRDNQGNNGASKFHLALKLNNAWYVSAAELVTPSGTTWQVGNFLVDPAAANWKSLTYSTGGMQTDPAGGLPTAGSLVLGDVAAADLTGTLQAIGFFVDFSAASRAINPSIDAVVINATPTQVEWRKGDCDTDYDVDFSDLGTLISNYNLPGGWPQGDFGNDGTVDFTDLGDLIANYGTDYHPTPEPATMSLLALAGLGLIRRRR